MIIKKEVILEEIEKLGMELTLHRKKIYDDSLDYLINKLKIKKGQSIDVMTKFFEKERDEYCFLDMYVSSFIDSLDDDPNSDSVEIDKKEWLNYIKEKAKRGLEVGF